MSFLLLLFSINFFHSNANLLSNVKFQSPNPNLNAVKKNLIFFLSPVRNIHSNKLEGKKSSIQFSFVLFAFCLLSTRVCPDWPQIRLFHFFDFFLVSFTLINSFVTLQKSMLFKIFVTKRFGLCSSLRCSPSLCFTWMLPVSLFSLSFVVGCFRFVDSFTSRPNKKKKKRNKPPAAKHVHFVWLVCCESCELTSNRLNYLHESKRCSCSKVQPILSFQFVVFGFAPSYLFFPHPHFLFFFVQQIELLLFFALSRSTLIDVAFEILTHCFAYGEPVHHIESFHLHTLSPSRLLRRLIHFVAQSRGVRRFGSPHRLVARLPLNRL